MIGKLCKVFIRNESTDLRGNPLPRSLCLYNDGEDIELVYEGDIVMPTDRDGACYYILTHQGSGYLEDEFIQEIE